jgi:quercetin dioxygenase-like cupin family protein
MATLAHMTPRRSSIVAAALAISAPILLAACSSGSDSMSMSQPSSLSTERDVTTINGETIPVPVKFIQDAKTMLDTVDANGNRLVITEGTRPAGTRAAIHIHKYGGHTCVISGTIIDYMEGHEPMTFPAGTCYYMPPNTLMTATNQGTEDAVLIDTFNLPVGEDTITIREPGVAPAPM